MPESILSNNLPILLYKNRLKCIVILLLRVQCPFGLLRMNLNTESIYQISKEGAVQ